MYMNKKYKIMYYYLVVILFTVFSLSSAFGVSELRDIHYSRDLTDIELDHLVQLSNITHLNTTIDHICVPRVVGTKSHDNVHNFIVSEMNNLGWHVEVDSFEDDTPIFGALVFRNIIATTNPTADTYLVFACHYDSKYFEKFYFVAATDSCVPCSMLINLAFTMKKELSTSRGDVHLKFVFFDGEEAFQKWEAEDSLYGARHLAAKYADQVGLTRSGEQIRYIDRINLFVLLDLLGTPNPRFHDYFANTSKWYKRLVEIEKRLRKLGHLNKSDDYFRDNFIKADIDDDHTPFLEREVPVIHLIPVPFPSVWHTKADNKDVIDIPTTENLNKMLRIFTAEYLHLSVKY